jgi:hypothetical protein
VAPRTRYPCHPPEALDDLQPSDADAFDESLFD